MKTLPGVIEKFLRYVQVDTRSVDGVTKQPSSPGQLELGGRIKDELLALGVDPSWISIFHDGSFVVVMPPSDGLEQQPHAAFAAHLDTYFNFPGAAHPIVHESYQSGDLALPNNNVIIPESDLKPYVGCRIITSDGTSVLGGDDKAGVASIVQTIQEILENDQPHGPLTFWFCVDEEIGKLDISAVPKELVESWKILWTVDGEEVGIVDSGSFVCRKLQLVFKGADAHPGVAGNKVKPAHYAAASFVAALNKDYSQPWETQGLESFYYVTNISGGASETKVMCMPRTFDQMESDEMALEVRGLAADAAEEFGVTVEVTDTLVTVNTKEAVEAHHNLLLPGITAHERLGIKVTEHDVRGGTDGGMMNLAYPDLPAPNMGAGAKNFHGPQEFVVLERLAEVPEIIVEMVRGYAEFGVEK